MNALPDTPERRIMTEVYALEAFAERYNWLGVRYRAERVLELIAALPDQAAAPESDVTMPARTSA